MAAVALFGTSADPPTLGHRALLEGLLTLYPRVATWASDNPLKQHAAPLPLRAALLHALVEAIADPRLEHHQELSSPWAIETLQRAAEHWPGQTLVFVVGSDLVPQIPRWRAAAAILEHCRLAIVPRQGFPLQPRDLEALQQQGARVDALPLGIPATASSAVRRTPDPAQVPPELRPLLLLHNLYGFGGLPSPP
ncbi:MAG: nicotinate-nucleotide adenylyltransferase [Prochlorococcaceae cyanobacterium]